VLTVQTQQISSSQTARKHIAANMSNLLMMMTSLLSSLFLFLAVCEGAPVESAVESGGPSEFCQRHEWGTYCMDDLSGYRECTGWSSDNSKRYQIKKEVICPTKTRCSCMKGNDCYGHLMRRDDEWNEKNICKPFVKADPIEDVLHVKYQKVGRRQISPFDDDETYEHKGEIKQDLISQTMFHTWVDQDNTRSFEIVIPNSAGNGTFYKYSGQHPDICSRSEINKLEVITSDLEYFTQNIKEIKNIGSSGFQKQVWYSDVYHAYQGLGERKKWTVLADTNSGKITPLEYEASYTATQEDQCCDYFEKTKFFKVPAKKSKRNNNSAYNQWSEIPLFCY